MDEDDIPEPSDLKEIDIEAIAQEIDPDGDEVKGDGMISISYGPVYYIVS